VYVVEAQSGPLDGKRWPISDEITVGRDANVVAAALPTDRAVSRVHALVRSTDRGLELEDLGSSNGTYLGGTAIAARVPIALGQPFVVGRTTLCVIEIEGSNAD
jgi:pSer/pThr/pTyr-binding forkhead associated (FHA) protein